MSIIKKLLVATALAFGVWCIPHSAKAVAYDFNYVSQTPFQTVNHGTHPTVKLSLQNSGTSIWQVLGPNAVHLGTSHSQDRGSGFYDPTSWLASNRIKITRNVSDPLNVLTVNPGQTAEFEFTVTPSLASDEMGGNYTEYFQPVVEGITWMKDIGLFWQWTVPAKPGVIMFTWYGGPSGGYGTDPNYRWFGSGVTPEGGLYDSRDPVVIRRQLTQMRDAGIRWVLLDFWNQEPKGGTYHNQQADYDIMNIIDAEFPDMQYAVLIEPTLNNSIAPIPQYIYDYLHANFAQRPHWMKYRGKPLIMSYLYRTCGGDGRFSCLQLSGAPGYQYPTMLAWHYPLPDMQGDMVSAFGRFDNFQCYALGECGNVLVQRYNVTFTEQMFDNQLQFVKDRRNGTRLFLFYSWNEHYESSGLEPSTSPYASTPAHYQLDKFSNFVHNNWNQ